MSPHFSISSFRYFRRNAAPVPRGLTMPMLLKRFCTSGSAKATLTAAVNVALADPEVQKRFNNIGIVKPRGTGAAFLRKYLNDEIEKWGDILRTTKDTD